MKNNRKDCLIITFGLLCIFGLAVIFSMFISGCGKKQIIKAEQEKEETIFLYLTEDCREEKDIVSEVEIMTEETSPKTDKEKVIIIKEPLKITSNKNLIKEVKVFYRVKKNDCLWKIAEEVYGTPFLWTKIYKANKKIINNPNLIFLNQILVCPSN